MNPRAVPALAVAALAAALSGCVADGPSLRVGEPVAIVDPSSVRIPWQLTPASTASEAQGERTEVRDVPGRGLVRATPVAFSYLDSVITPFRRGGGPAARACSRIVARQARSAGAFAVEDGVAGPARPTWSGHDATQVFFRIWYRRGDLTEVRQAALRCVVDRRGRLVGATPA